jgi:hypothetical protein
LRKLAGDVVDYLDKLLIEICKTPNAGTHFVT